MKPLQIAIAGAGAMGRKHIAYIDGNADAAVAAIVDPFDEARGFAAARGALWAADMPSLFNQMRPDGIVIATPNHRHCEDALCAMAHGVPALLEKPAATSFTDAVRIAQASTYTGVPILVGHHRRHNPLLQAARAAVQGGGLGG